MAQPNKTGKTMSANLARLKFMQRFTASPRSSPDAPPEPASKKQRLSNGSYASTPSSTPRSDAQAINEALAAEEKKRTEAWEKEAADRGETKWYLSFQEPQRVAQQTPLRIVSAGFSSLDASSTIRDLSSDDDVDVDVAPQTQGRRSFGKFNRSLEEPNQRSSDSDSSSDSFDQDDEADDSDDPTGAKAMIARTRKEAGEKARAERKAKRKAEKAEAIRMADERRRKLVKLNQLGSISGGGSMSTRSPNYKDMVCFKCNQKGHPQKDCPRSSQKRSFRR